MLNHNLKNQSKSNDHRNELVVTGLTIWGVALLVTDLPFHVIIQMLIQFLGDTFDMLIQACISIFVTPFIQGEFSDIIGMILIALSIALTIGQLRRRMISHSNESNTCPGCNHKLHRIHRKSWQLLLSKTLYLSSGYFHCATCDHSSLRFYQKIPHLNRG